MKISCFTAMQRKIELEQIFPALAKAGYDGIELMGNVPHLPPDAGMKRAEQIKKLSETYNMPIIAISAYSGRYVDVDQDHIERQLKELEQHCKMANLFGCDMVRHAPGGPPSSQASESDWQQAADGLRQACDLAANYNILLSMEIEGHWLVGSADDAIKFCELVGRDNLGTVHDTGNMYLNSVDSGEGSVLKLGVRLFHVHVKDLLYVSDKSLPGAFYVDTRKGQVLCQGALLGRGGTDHHSMLRGLKKVGYSGYVSTECFTSPDDLSICKKEIDTLRKIMDEVG